MDKEQAIEIARAAMAGLKTHAGRETGYIFHHGLRVGQLALSLLDASGLGEDVDRHILFAGGLFHDIGKGSERHAEAGANRATALLGHVCSREELQQIALLVAQHNQRGDEALPLDARLVQDADILDHVGAQMVWLLFQFSAHHDRSPQQTLDYYFSDEHQEYLARLREALNLEAARHAFDRRRALEGRLLRQLEIEIAGGL